MWANSLRSSGKYFLNSKELGHLYNPLNVQSIRWRRKPRWLEVAPSKKFRIPTKPSIPSEEHEELRSLHNIYNTDMKSLRSYFVKKTQELLTGKDVIAEKLKLEEEEHQKCMQINEEWNKSVATLREQRIAIEKEEELARIISTIEEGKIKHQERIEVLSALVRKEKELSQSYITSDNIDDSIEKSLSTVLDEEFSIDIEGNIYKGRETKPILQVTEEKKTHSEAAI